MATLKVLPSALLAVAVAATVACATPQAAEQAQQVVSDTSTENGTITAIDGAQRMVSLRTLKGDVSVHAGEDVQNFDQLRIGDVVTVIHNRSVLVDLQPAEDSTAPGAYIKEDKSLAPSGGLPGASSVETVTVLAPIVAIDTARNTLSVKDPGGKIKVLDVKKPENQQKLAGLKVGQVLRIRFVEGKAISISPRR